MSTTTVVASIDGYVECAPEKVEALTALARRVDERAGATEPEGGYTLAATLAAILNGATPDEIAEAFRLVAGWSFTPTGGW